MHAGFGLAVVLAFAFALTNGFHDASNAIATLVATRAARPLQAVVLASVFNVLGPMVVGAAVARHDRGIVTLAPEEAIQVIGAGLAAAVTWNVLTLVPAGEPGRDRPPARWQPPAPATHSREELSSAVAGSQEFTAVLRRPVPSAQWTGRRRRQWPGWA